MTLILCFAPGESWKIWSSQNISFIMVLSWGSSCFQSLQTQPMGHHVNVRTTILVIPIWHLGGGTMYISDSYCLIGFCISGYWANQVSSVSIWFTQYSCTIIFYHYFIFRIALGHVSLMPFFRWITRHIIERKLILNTWIPGSTYFQVFSHGLVCKYKGNLVSDTVVSVGLLCSQWILRWIRYHYFLFASCHFFCLQLVTTCCCISPIWGE